MDHFIGKNACYDVWPGILHFLDKYAENNMAKNKKAMRSMKKAIHAVKLVAHREKRMFSKSINIIFFIMNSYSIGGLNFFLNLKGYKDTSVKSSPTCSMRR